MELVPFECKECGSQQLEDFITVIAYIPIVCIECCSDDMTEIEEYGYQYLDEEDE